VQRVRIFGHKNVPSCFRDQDQFLAETTGSSVAAAPLGTQNDHVTVPDRCGTRRHLLRYVADTMNNGGVLMTTQSTLDTSIRETPSLIGSDKVEGTAVYRSNGDKVGTIERVMIDKISGKVAYAVMSFGGFMGIGEDSYPLPWNLLTYNPRLQGYEVNIGEDQLKGAPKYSEHETWDWTEPRRVRSVNDYWGALS
jgi:hypothetical protein